MAYSELQGSPRERLGIEGVEVVRQFRGPYADRFTFLESLPYNFPLAPFQNATLSQVEIEPMGCPALDPGMEVVSEINSHDEAWITATWEISSAENNGEGAGGGGGGGGGGKAATREEADDGTYYEVETSGEMEVYTAKNGGLQWLYQDPAAVPFIDPDGNGFPIRYPIQSINLRWGRVTSPDFAQFDSLLGSVNASTVTLPVVNTSHAAETLRFDSYLTRIRFDNKSFTDPKTKWEVEFKFQRKNVIGQWVFVGINSLTESDGVTYVIGWNHFFRSPVKAGWEPVQVDGKPPYPLRSWSGLLVQV
jgi:hypothetical protein